jgi:hypothetical protein
MLQIHVRREVNVYDRSALSGQGVHNHSLTDFDMLSPEVLPATLSPSMLITIVQDPKPFALSLRLPGEQIAITPARSEGT